MNHIYTESVGIIPAIADLSMADDDVWEVNRINVPVQSRGLGHGTRLLKRITADADEEGATLILNIFASGPLDAAALESWYARNGFALNPEFPEAHEMIRLPRSH